MTTNRQQVDDFSVRISPDVRLNRHTDYFGTEVVEFEVSRPHHRLEIDIRARVRTEQPPSPPEGAWAAVRGADYAEAGGEYLLQTDDAPDHPVLSELLAATAGTASPLALVQQVAELIPARFEYRKGATFVDSPLRDVLDGGAGVCQDFVHLALYVLRAHGIAARYVSGYLFSTRDAGDVESVEVDTHAWLEALLPDSDPARPEPIWVGVDPTNRGFVGVQHVKIGHGRHYADVPPIKGVYRGMANSELTASVTMTRLESGASTRS